MGMRCTETDLVRACLNWLALHRVLAWRSNNTGIFDPTRKVFRSFHGLKGVSDILGIVPRPVVLPDGGRATVGALLAVECKRPGEKLRAEQEAFLEDVRGRGGIGFCARSLRDLEEHLGALLM